MTLAGISEAGFLSCPGGWGASPGSFDFFYFLISLPLSHSGSPFLSQVILKDRVVAYVASSQT
jgi:hypothetical protein